MNLSGEAGQFKDEYILYYKMMVLVPDNRSAETVYEELNEVVNFVQNSGKFKLHDNRNAILKIKKAKSYTSQVDFFKATIYKFSFGYGTNVHKRL